MCLGCASARCACVPGKSGITTRYSFSAPVIELEEDGCDMMNFDLLKFATLYGLNGGNGIFLTLSKGKKELQKLIALNQVSFVCFV